MFLLSRDSKNEIESLRKLASIFQVRASTTDVSPIRASNPGRKWPRMKKEEDLSRLAGEKEGERGREHRVRAILNN